MQDFSPNSGKDDQLPSVLLRCELEHLRGYADAGMVPVPKVVAGLGVFPGGHGLWTASGPCIHRPLQHPAVMIVANDFYTADGFGDILKSGGERATDPFWKHLLHLLRDAGIPLESCFFTNAIMGLRARGGSTGESPGFRHAGFRAACARFLARQVEVVEPSVILTLGEFAPQVLAITAPSLSGTSPWPGYGRIDQDELALQRSVRIDGSSRVVGAVAILVHPSYRPVNVGRRTFRSHSGHRAEVELVKAAMQTASTV